MLGAVSKEYVVGKMELSFFAGHLIIFLTSFVLLFIVFHVKNNFFQVEMHLAATLTFPPVQNATVFSLPVLTVLSRVLAPSFSC